MLPQAAGCHTGWAHFQCFIVFVVSALLYSGPSVWNALPLYVRIYAMYQLLILSSLL